MGKVNSSLSSSSSGGTAMGMAAGALAGIGKRAGAQLGILGGIDAALAEWNGIFLALPLCVDYAFFFLVLGVGLRGFLGLRARWQLSLLRMEMAMTAGQPVIPRANL